MGRGYDEIIMPQSELEVRFLGHTARCSCILRLGIAFGWGQAKRLNLEPPPAESKRPIFSDILIASTTAFM